MANTLNRRSFLKAFGAAGAASATLPLLPSLSSSAEAGQFPKRLILFFSSNGTIRDQWSPTGSRYDFSFGDILSPLAGFKDKLIIPEGLDNVIGRRENSPGKGHPRGMGSVLTGYPLLEGDLGDFSNRRNTSGWAGGPSIDHFIADRLNLGQKTPHKVLNLGVVSEDSLPPSPHATMTYSSRDQPVFPDHDVYRVFDRLFSDTHQTSSEMEALRVQRRSVLDVIKGEFGALNRKVSAADRARLEEHFQSVRDVEKQLTTESAAQCEKPDMSGDRINVNSRSNVPQLGRLQIDQLVMSLKCDLTRVASIQYNRSTSMLLHRWLGHSGRDDKHHNLSHRSDGDSYARRRLIEINNWYAKQFAYLLEQLDAVPEGDGTLLDNSVVVWVSELGKGNSHTLDDLPFVVAGGCGGALQTGQHLKFGNRFHQDLWVTIAQAMGVPIESFGAERTCTGPITEMLA